MDFLHPKRSETPEVEAFWKYQVFGRAVSSLSDFQSVEILHLRGSWVPEAEAFHIGNIKWSLERFQAFQTSKCRYYTSKEVSGLVG